LFGRLRGMFNRNDSCCQASCSSCDSGCANGSCGAAPAPGAAPGTAPPATPAPGGETIQEAPKKLPATPAPKGDRSQVQFQGEPAPFNAAPAYQPVIQSRPAPAAVPSSLRNPF